MSAWNEPLRRFETWERAADVAAGTIELRRFHLRRLATDFPDGPRSLTTQALETWIGGHHWATETMRSHRATARAFCKWAARFKVIDADPAVELPQIRPGSHVPRPVSELAWRRARKDSDARTALIIELGARCGLRRAEISAVRSADVEQDLMGWSLRVRGKGRKVRRIPLPDDLASRILAARGWVFPSPSGGHLTPAHIGVLVRRASNGEWSTHQLRHRFGTAVYVGSHDLLATQSLMGHSKPETTAGYVALADAALRDAARSAQAAA